MSNRPILFSVIRSEIIRLHDELEQEHQTLSGNWLGRPRKRHHQIIGASRAINELFKRLDTISRKGDA